MKQMILFGFLLSQFLGQAQATPLCSQVMLNPGLVISEEAITTSIKQMAQLKLDLDRAQARGSQEGISNHYVLNQYPKKYQELVQGLQGRLSEKEIANRIKKEIRQLQNESKVSTREKNRRLKKETEFIENFRPLYFEYELVSKSRGRSYDGPSNQSESIFLPEQNAFFYFNRTSFVKFPLDNSHLWGEDISKVATTGALLSDNKTMLLFEQDRLVTYDLKSGNFGRKQKIKMKRSASLPPDIQNMSLSPSDNLALLEGYESRVGYRYSVVDINTGVELLNKNDFPKKASGVTFLNEQQVAVIGENKKLVIIDIASKAIVESKVLKSIVYDPEESHITPRIILSNDGSILTIAHSNGFISLDAKNVRNKLSEVIQADAFYHITKARGYPHAMLVEDRTNEIRLVDMDTLAKEFTFESISPTWEARGIIPSPDGAEALIISSKDNGSDRNSQHWQRLR